MHKLYLFLLVTLLSFQHASAQERGEDTIGYTKFEGICQSETFDKRPFVSTIICANRCDRNTKCAGFQVSNYSYSLMVARCQPARLITTVGSQISSDPTKQFSQVGQPQAYQLPSLYYMREVPCKLSAECPSKCLVPNANFSCDCIDGYCYPYVTTAPTIEGYQHYNGSCQDLQFGRNYPIESILQCKAKCSGDPKCTGFSLEKRFCQTLTRVCSPQSFQQQNSSERLGRHYYVKNSFNNFTCRDDDDCRYSPRSVCEVAAFGIGGRSHLPPPAMPPLPLPREYNDRCRCYSNECIILTDGSSGALPSLPFLKRLKAKEPFHVTSANDMESKSDCFDKHICCSTLFKNPGSCSDADAITCPRSCGICTNFVDCGKPETITEDPYCAFNVPLCSHPTLSPLMAAQCSKSCKTCGKSANDLGILCSECIEERQDCEYLANNDQCSEFKTKCRKSCECIVY